MKDNNDEAQERDETRSKSEHRWEEWIGVRGAALLGGLSILVAFVYFFRFAVEQGWFGWFGPEEYLGLAYGIAIAIVCGAEFHVRSSNRLPSSSQ